MKKTLMTLVVIFTVSIAQATIIDDYSDYDSVGAGVYDTGSGWSI